jgi:hypothetical protein
MLSTLSFAFLAGAMPAAAPFYQPAVPVVQECRKVALNREDHIPSISAIAAIGSSHGHKLLPSKAFAAVAAVARLYGDFYLIYEHGLCS